MYSNLKKAYCVLTSCHNNEDIHGLVYIDEFLHNNTLGSQFNIFIRGLSPNTLHGCHIHVGNDLSKGCNALGGHFNPTNQRHGGLNSGGHAGDLGNVYADNDGMVNMLIYSDNLRLQPGKFNIMNRSLIIHADLDDLGKGGDSESLKTGNSGKRILAGIIMPRN